MKAFQIGDLKISLPIIQGGMGVGVSLSGLASAVASEGGVGVISCAGIGLYYPKLAKDYFSSCVEGLKEEIHKARSKTSGVIGVNIMVVLQNFSDMVKTCISEKVDIIFSGAGLPLDLPSYLTKDSVTKLVPIVSSARAAKLICDKWINNFGYVPDAIVVEGPKAGGHLGYKVNQIEDENFSLEKIVPEVVDQIKIYEEKHNRTIPVIAAGGIMTGEDIYKMIELGATAVQLGTKFVTTTECDASEDFKQTYLRSTKSDIEIIQSPVGLPGRAINGEFIQHVKEGTTKPKRCSFNCIKSCDYTKSAYCIVKALFFAAKGNLKKGYAFAGANAYLSDKISSVKETIETLKREYEQIKIKN
ncbi:MAG: nitronate monooxygenase [Rikenellaceae bacterium]